MIKPNELRLGNYVFYNGKIETVHQVNYHEDIRLNLYADKYTCEDIQPIPLTPEWLERCEFVKDQHGRNRYTHGAYAVILGSGGVENVFCLINSTMLSTCKYLHQLQNLYFTLTGEELAIAVSVS